MYARVESICAQQAKMRMESVVSVVGLKKKQEKCIGFLLWYFIKFTAPVPEIVPKGHWVHDEEPTTGKIKVSEIVETKVTHLYTSELHPYLGLHISQQNTECR
jgi:hypothetical protein